ncbi:MAG: PD-(D/E)XK nuclease domain-containing protein, partial [Rhodocyclaceae bacterium]
AAAGNAQPVLQQRSRLGRLLMSNDFSGMESLFTAFFASIPHDWFRNNPIAQYEGYYASVFYAYFASLGLDIVPEESSNAGRLDMAVRFNGHVYLFEFKVVELEPEGAALEQIKQKGYADKYRDRNEPIHLIGVEFSREQRRVVGFAVETL